jgi:hypothetical protein
MLAMQSIIHKISVSKPTAYNNIRIKLYNTCRNPEPFVLLPAVK